MTHAIRVHDYGGPEVLTWEEVDVGEPGPVGVELDAVRRRLKTEVCRGVCVLFEARTLRP